MSTFEIDHQLSLADIISIFEKGNNISLSQNAVTRIAKCRQYLDTKIENPDAIYYGINTGFGSLCNTQINVSELEQLQYNLLRSHACGTGDYVPHHIVKLMLLLKIQSLAYGHSAVQVETVERLMWMFNNNILPVIYEQGSLGASGDLAPLAHLSLPLIGEGEVWVNLQDEYVKKQSHEVLAQHNLHPIKLKSKEGLALINGTQFMLSYAVWCVWKGKHLMSRANEIAAMSVDAFDCRMEPFNHLLHDIRNHKGQIAVARSMCELLEKSEIANKQKTQVQDPYAFRCIPQVHGASYDTVAFAEQVVTNEMNAVTDNPNVFPDEDLILSGGNFHGQPLALMLDYLAIALAELGSISERRTYQLISGQRGLPAFLTPNPGLNSGMMIPQYTAASIVSQNKQLCTPASVDSIVSSNGQEDHVSMGANAATKCLRVLNNVRTILAIELLNAAQALDLRRPLKSSTQIEQLHQNYRKHVAFMSDDRYLSPDIQKTMQFID
jgi:histidine ammonia-lyase